MVAAAVKYISILYDAIIVFYTGTIKNLVTYGVLLFEGVKLSVKKSLVFRRNSDWFKKAYFT